MSPRSLSAAAFLTVIMLSAMALSLLSGSPSADRLPAISMEWLPLFHLQRAAALLGVLSAVALIGWRALNGEFPVRFVNIEYQIEKAVESTEELSSRIRALELLVLLPEDDSVEGEDHGA